MKLSNIQNLGLSLLFLGVVQVPARAINITIDSFDQNDQTLTINRPNNGNQTKSNLATGLTTAIGGSRYIELNVQGTLNRITTLAVDTLTQTAYLDTGGSNLAATLFKWDANGFGLGGIDLEQYGNNSFELSIYTDHDIAVTFEVKDTSGNTSILTKNVLTNTSTESNYFNYSSFIGTANINSIDSITMKSSLTQSHQFEYGFLQTAQVPFEFSPTLGMLLTSGLFGLVFLKNKLNQANN